MLDYHAMMPSAWYLQAQRFRGWWRNAVLPVFRDVDVLIAPATPVAAARTHATAATNLSASEHIVEPHEKAGAFATAECNVGSDHHD